MKGIAVILVIILLFSACGTQTANNAAPTQTKTPQPTDAPSKETIMYELSENIAVNQIGCRLHAKKTFWVTGDAKTFDVVCADTGKIVYSGKIKAFGMDEAVGASSCFGDFSEVSSEGKYFIAVDGKTKSYEFEISDNAYGSLKDGLLKMLYYQRCGIELSEEFAGEYAHAACHTDMGGIWNESGGFDAAGGWHDAGDYGKYTVPCVRTVADLLFSYQLYPEVFGDDTAIPESLNGVPDILDEARVGLSWLLKMQRPDGGVYHKFTSAGFCGMVMPEDDYLTQYAISVSPTATAGFCAIMAKSSTIYGKIDADFAAKCREAALAAWGFLTENPDLPMFQNPEGVTTGDYKDTSDRDERYWAAVELFLLTDETQYLQEAEKLYLKHTALFWSDTLEWYDVGFLGTFSYLLSEKADTGSGFYKTIKADATETADKLCGLAQNHAFGVAMGAEDYIWGSSMVLTNRADVLLMAYELAPRPEYLQTAQAHLDYLLGKNALSQCYVTGFGSKPIMYPHHRPSVADRIKAPVPGMVSGGPNARMEDPAARMNFDMDTPPALCFLDETAAYSLNEVTTYWNSSALFCAAGLISNK